MKYTDCIHIGTSGWDYPHSRSRFYLDDLPKKTASLLHSNVLDNLCHDLINSVHLS
ncbi:MAG: hypothetical protein GVY04_01280 [Cyanobacteria bacterium]|nr:hypothetical protein [Cyanobacteria bacterium GSL.Bin1]